MKGSAYHNIELYEFNIFWERSSHFILNPFYTLNYDLVCLHFPCLFNLKCKIIRSILKTTAMSKFDKKNSIFFIQPQPPQL